MKNNEKNNNPRMLIAKLREGNYAHPGEEEAIDLVFGNIQQLINKQVDSHLKGGERLRVIDIGCGLGGTANYISKNKNFDTYGVDIDLSAINHAKSIYKNTSFFNFDVLDIKENLTNGKFDIIYMFNVFYVFSEKEKILKLLAEIANPNALLIIFDYCHEEKNTGVKLTDFSGKEMFPIIHSELESDLNHSGWHLIKSVSLSQKYEEWYSKFLDKLQQNKELLLQCFTKESFDKVEELFFKILGNIKEKSLGGAVYYASKIN